MHKHNLSLLRSLPLAMLLAAPLSPAHAQSFLNKLVEKAQQAGGALLTTAGEAGKISASDAAQQEADRADQTLNKRPFKEDIRGMNGIYFTNFLLAAESLNQEKVYPIGKVLIEYDENKGAAAMYTRYAFEANDPAKLVPKAVWVTANSGASFVKGQKNVERVLLSTPGADTSNKYRYMQMSFRQDLQGNEIPDKPLPTGLGVLFELEPGVLYLGQPPYLGSKSQPYGHNLLKPGMQIPLLYKEGKAEAAASWTMEKIVALYRKIADAGMRASEEVDAQADPNLTLLPPADPAPSRAELEGAKAQWQRVITDRNVADTQTQRKFKLVYVYPTSPWSEMRKKQFINNSWVDAVINRSRVYSATFQDQEGKYWNNRFYLVEKAPLGVYFGERWSGQYEYALPASAVPKALTKEAALKYQNSAGGK